MLLATSAHGRPHARLLSWRALKAKAAAALHDESSARSRDPDEARILAHLDRGDRARAETELFQVYGARVLGRCLRMMRQRDRAEDACQRAFLEACRDLPRFERRSSLYTWLCRIATNRCLDALRSHRSQRAHIDDDAEIEAASADRKRAPDAVLERDRLLAALVACLDELPEAMRETVILRFQNDDLSYEDMAMVLHAKAATLNQRVVRALPLLADCLQSKGWDGG